MNLDELRSLDPRDPGRWPLAVRAGVIGIVFVVLSLVGLYLVVWNGQREDLQRYETEELDLRNQYREKHSKAVNLDLYKQQLADIERGLQVVFRRRGEARSGLANAPCQIAVLIVVPGPHVASCLASSC